MKLWQGRFTKDVDEAVNDFNSSLHFDWRMYVEDIRGSMAHVKMLAKQGIITAEDAASIAKELDDILVSFSPENLNDQEDIHMYIESVLIERLGDVGRRLHTARSRNDQVALDLRLYLVSRIGEIAAQIKGLQTVILDISQEHKDTVMPGYTHLQKAQPLTLAHHMMAYFEMFKRDVERFSECSQRMSVSPLGAGALAGSTYPLDREFVAKQLGLRGVTHNSIDSVSDRDFVIETAFCGSMVMMHLSRFCEELILWNTQEFSFLEMDDAFSTGSSIMPQKKNPDVAELVRGKTGRVYGQLMALFTIMKGLPLAYNKDMQEDKPAIFDVVDTLELVLPVFAKMLATIKFNEANMLSGAKGGFTNATDAADYLVKKGVPFRTAHEIIGKLVLYALENGKSLDDLGLDEYRAISDVFEQDVFDAINVKTCVEQRDFVGCASVGQVSERIKEGRAWVLSN